MATRAEIQQLIESKIYDNLNKEILASMVREVLEGFKDSYFNLDEDELANQNYNSTQTLSQFFNTLPNIKRGTIGSFDFGGSGTVPVSGSFINSASYGLSNTDDVIINVSINENIAQKTFFISSFTNEIGDAGLNERNDIAFPVYRVDPGNVLSIAFRNLGNNNTGYKFNIFMI